MRHLLWTLTAATSAAAAAMIVWALRPLYASGAASSTPSALGAHSAAGSSQLDERHGPLPLAAYERDWTLDLRRPLFDPPPPPPPEKVVFKPPPLTIKLAGTVIDDTDNANSRAIVTMPDGKQQFVAIGEKAGEAQIVKINAGDVIVQYYGESITLKVDGSGKGQGG